MQSRKSAWNQPQDFRRDFLVGKIDIFRPQGVGDRLIKSVRIDETAVHYRLRDSFAIQVRLIQGIVRLRRLQDALLNENLSNLFVVHLEIDIN